MESGIRLNGSIVLANSNLEEEIKFEGLAYSGVLGRDCKAVMLLSFSNNDIVESVEVNDSEIAETLGSITGEESI